MTNTDISDYWRNEVRLTTDSQPTPPALPADMPTELLRGVTSQPVKVERGPSRIWTGVKFEVVEAVTAVIF